MTRATYLGRGCCRVRAHDDTTIADEAVLASPVPQVGLDTTARQGRKTAEVAAIMDKNSQDVHRSRLPSACPPTFSNGEAFWARTGFELLGAALENGRNRIGRIERGGENEH